MSLCLEILGKAANGDHDAVHELRFNLLQKIRYASTFNATQPYTNPIEKMIRIFASRLNDSEKGMILSRLDDFADYVADQILSQVDRSVLLVEHTVACPGMTLLEFCETFTGWLRLKRNDKDKAEWVVKHLSSMSLLGVPLPVASPAVEEAVRIGMDPSYGYDEQALVRYWDGPQSWNSFKRQERLDYHFQSISDDSNGVVSEEGYDYGALTSAKVALELAGAGFGRSQFETQLDIRNLAKILNVDLRNAVENLHSAKPTDGYRPIAWHNVWWNIAQNYDGLPLILELRDPKCETAQKLADFLSENYADVKNVNRLTIQRRRTRLSKVCDDVILDVLVISDGVSRVTTF